MVANSSQNREIVDMAKKGKNTDSSSTDPIASGSKQIRILIVDDSEINQFLIKKSLEQIGAESDFADNGLTAVEKIKQKKWNLVLMDLFMPEIDGFEATRIVRKLKGQYFKNLPIIALTSHPFGEIQDEIFAAGMTDFLTKPLDSKLLAEMIKNYSKENDQSAHTISKQLDKIRFKKALHHSMNEINFYRTLLEMIRENLTELDSQIQTALDNSDHNKIRDYQHKIRPTLKLLEKGEIDTLLSEARVLVNDNPNSRAVSKIVNQIRKKCHQTISQINEELAEIASS